MTKQYQKENGNLKNSSSPSARSNFAYFLISLFLIATAYFTSAQAQASAASGGDTVNISTSADLTAFRNRVNQGETSLDAVLLNNIDLENAEWTPIYKSKDTVGYTGKFNGNGYKITNYKITQSLETAGLFGVIGGSGVVKNLTVSGDISVSRSGGYVGAIAGNNLGTIENVTNNGKTTASGSNGKAGGIVGVNQNVIIACANNGETSGGTAGGIAGYNSYAAIKNCTNNGKTVTNTSGGNIGGIAGSAYYTAITDCTNNGETSYESVASAGGILGSGGYSTSIRGCTNNGKTATPKGYAGGITGDSIGISITNCISKGNVISDSDPGGVLGYAYYSVSSIDRCAYLGSGDLPVVGSKTAEPAVTNTVSLDNKSIEEVVLTYTVQRISETEYQIIPGGDADYSKYMPSGVVLSYDQTLISCDYKGNGKFTVTGGSNIFTNIDILGLCFSDVSTYPFGIISSDNFIVTACTGVNIEPNPQPADNTSGSSNGCNTGFAALALLAIVPIAIKKKK